MKESDEASGRLAKNDVKYRFVIDMPTRQAVKPFSKKEQIWSTKL
jgi:hypothetical protein